MYSNLITRGALTFLFVTVLASPAWAAQADKFEPHSTAPGPKRLQMEKADNSGTVKADIQFIADRLAILNHISAYPFLFDEGRLDDWFALFSDDVSFENTTPTLGTVIVKGKKAFREMVSQRYGPKEVIPVRRHTMGTISTWPRRPRRRRRRVLTCLSPPSPLRTS